MRKSILIILALALVTGTASAKLGDLVQSFRNVGTSTHYGLAADANYLYSYYYYSIYRYPVLRLRRSNGAFVSSYPIPGSSTWYPRYTRGLSYDGAGYLYGNNYSRRYVARFRASNGSLLSTWNWPSGTRYGICADHKGTSAGTYIYQSYYNGEFYKSRLTGSLVSSWSMPYPTYFYDHAWDYYNKLIWGVSYLTDWIYAIDPNPPHKMLYSFRHPKWATISSCYGIAYWGDYLYVANESGSPDAYIWVFHCPHYLGVRPASVGKIKALFE
ncbi:MAG: hypothetical protein GTN49_07710 [candidate division Zixibacteria bacterium]|nr:hypothetical protein [candidate division Zixibacteria bacterium]